MHIRNNSSVNLFSLCPKTLFKIIFWNCKSSLVTLVFNTLWKWWKSSLGWLRIVYRWSHKELLIFLILTEKSMKVFVSNQCLIFFTHVVRALVASCALVICQCELCSGGGVVVSGECLLRLNMAFNTLPFKLIKGRGGSRGGRTRPKIGKKIWYFFA